MDKTVKREYDFYSKMLNENTINKLKGGKGNPLAFYNSRIYRLFTSSMFKVLNSFEKGSNKEYYKYLNQSHGDYSKRKGGDIARRMASYTEFVKDILDSNNGDLQYSLLGIFIDIYEILTDRSWISAFGRAFSHIDKTGAANTIITSFKMIYMALVITFESIGLKLVLFEYDMIQGSDPAKSIEKIMTQHSSFMKSIALPMIKIICMCRNIKDPLSAVNGLINDENKVKDAKKRAGESGYPYKPEENGLTAVESYKIEQLDNASFAKSNEAAGPLAAVGAAVTALLGGGGGAAAAGGAGTAAVGGLSILGLGTGLSIAVIVVMIILLIAAVPVARLVIYWLNVRKVDIEKELEMQAELLSNNITRLKEKLDKTSDKEERARLQNIIDKQIAILKKIQEDIKKYLDDDYEAAVEAQQTAEDDDSSYNAEDGGGGGFEVAI
jgi:hypothetical protein